MTIKDLKELIKDYSDDVVVVAVDDTRTNHIELTDMFLSEDSYINAYGEAKKGKIFIVC